VIRVLLHFRCKL